ncbi:MAG: hypothetical protein ABSB70_16810 [Candidatus Velthaea sp.]|jgi:hypothetical protein
MSMPTISPRRTTTASNPRGRQLLIVLVVVLVVFEALKLMFGHHENKFEKLAYNVTAALQNNNLDEVKKYQNAETATMINRGIVGRAADRLAPLGKIKTVKETTPSGSPDQIHEFTVAFDKGTVHEKMKVDPELKIVHFEYNRVSP